ncbi:hypothetical protein PMAYCL1PPCAC_27521 [Pristionchus mayeri]|uniref:Large ribosomal subunit protein P1 n=1 Tax=Pristionchus mayeri TaxID=1317129 RepID=A0AAN5D6I9_9BILA|nr:hypothetical protein PMAYCL1PPCAC_27521 [Pristionchus mayeri]
MSTIEEQACVYAALILHADDLPITGDKIATILRAANVTVEPFWPGLFAMALEGVNVANLISSVACSVGDGAPAASAAPSGDAPVAAGSSAMNKGDEDSEDDQDLGFGLFD